MSELRKLLLDLQTNYPQACLSDHIKWIYQSEFGCGHFVSDTLQARIEMQKECAAARRGRCLFEKLGSGYRRVYLKNALELGASIDTLTAMFVQTAQNSRGSNSRFRTKLQELSQLCREGALPFSSGACQLYLLNYEAAGYPSVHHSTAYHKAYAPAYRVISENYARFFELFLRIDRLLASEKEVILVAIDGPCASGKTTLSSLLASCYDCGVFHADDFYLRPEQKTSERLQEAGGNMDRERLQEEVLTPLCAQAPVCYRPYSCKTQTLRDGTIIPFHRLNIIEGSYSLHPTLRHFYNLKVVLDISPEHQLRRLKRRESQKSLEAFLERWIPLEQNYARTTDLFSCADLIYPC